MPYCIDAKMKYLLIILSFFLVSLTSLGKTVYVGGGGGFLNLGNIQTSLTLSAGDIVWVKWSATAYTGMFIQNSRFTDSVYVMCSDSGVVFTGTVQVQNCKSIVFSRFVIDLAFAASQRGFNFDTNSDSCTLRNSRIQRCADYGIVMFSTVTYDGTNSFDNMSFIDDTVRAIGNANAITTAGGTNNNGPVLKNPLFRRVWIDSTYGSTGSNGIQLSNRAYNLLIENCKFTHTNLGATAHNSLMYFQGFGIIRNIYSLDRQGDLIRARPYWLDSSASHSTTDTSWVYNIIDVGARKYATYEVQHLPADTTTNTNLPNVRTGIMIVCYISTFNTRTSDYFSFSPSTGGGAGTNDIYQYYRFRPVMRNCLNVNAYLDTIAHCPCGDYTFNYMAHDGGGSKPSGFGAMGDTTGNKYSQSFVTMGIPDSLTARLILGSPAIDAGNDQYLYKITTDFYGNPRKVGAHSDDGAVEFQGVDPTIWGPVRWRGFKKVN